jgi:protocatechuate 3,4-dioxygenase beta subunit
MPTSRRHLLLSLGAAGLATAAACADPADALLRRTLREMTEGPFYPPPRWRAARSDWDADLTRVQQRDGAVAVARGEHLGLVLAVVDARGRAVDGCEVEIWQCDSLAHYHHPDVPYTSGRWDPGFQGFGTARSDRAGQVSFRTLRPVAYPGRTPHIHFKLRHAQIGELTSQLFVAGDPGNAEDFLWRRLPAADRTGLALRLQTAPAASAGSAGSGLAWVAQHELVVPG